MTWQGKTRAKGSTEADEPFTYRQGTFARRMWVITAGSVMHMIIAFVLIVGIYATWGQPGETGTVTLGGVVAGSPADSAGLVAGDVIVSVDGASVTNADAFRNDDGMRNVAATLIQHPNVSDKVSGYLGVAPWSQDRIQLGLVDSLTEGPKDLLTGVGQAIVGVAKVINPVNVFGHLVGTNNDVSSRPGTIVGAAKVSDDIGRFDGWAGALSLLAALNISVGVFNMFPLMPLDGGHAGIAIYERLRSRNGKRYYADANKLMPVAAACLMLLAFMFLTGLYLDTVQG